MKWLILLIAMALPTGTDYGTAPLPNPDSDQTDTWVVIDLEDMPPNFWSAVNTSDGSRGRASKDDASEENATELATHWVDFDDVGQTGIVWVRWSGTNSATASETIRIYPPNTGNPSYSSTDTFGSEAVWVNFAFVGLLNESGDGSVDEFADASGNGNHGQGGGGTGTMVPTQVAGKIGNAQQFDGTDDYIIFGNGAAVNFTAGDSFTYLGWINTNSVTEDGTVLSHRGDPGGGSNFSLFYINDGFVFAVKGDSNNSFVSAGTASVDTWYHLVGTYDGVGGTELFRNATSLGTGAGSIGATETVTNGELYAGRIESISTSIEDILDGSSQLLMVYNSVMPDDMISYAYDNQNDISTFWGTWTWQGGGGGDESISVSEVGSGADQVSISADVTETDVGSGADDVGIQASLSVQDAGQGADDISAQVQALVEDVGGGLDDIATVQVQATVQDAGSGTDTTTITANIPVTDAGSGSDAINVIKEILITVADSGHGSDAVSTDVDLSVQDVGAGTDQVSIDVALDVSDTGQGIDAIDIIKEKLVQIADAGQGLDEVQVNVQLQLSEQGFASEAVAIENTLSVIDQGQGVDSVVTFDADVFIADITFSFTQRVFEYVFAQRSFDYNFKQRSFEYAFEGQN